MTYGLSLIAVYKSEKLRDSEVTFQDTIACMGRMHDSGIDTMSQIADADISLEKTRVLLETLSPLIVGERSPSKRGYSNDLCEQRTESGNVQSISTSGQSHKIPNAYSL